MQIRKYSYMQWLVHSLHDISFQFPAHSGDFICMYRICHCARRRTAFLVFYFEQIFIFTGTRRRRHFLFQINTRDSSKARASHRAMNVRVSLLVQHCKITNRRGTVQTNVKYTSPSCCWELNFNDKITLKIIRCQSTKFFN